MKHEYMRGLIMFFGYLTFDNKIIMFLYVQLSGGYCWLLKCQRNKLGEKYIFNNVIWKNGKNEGID